MDKIERNIKRVKKASENLIKAIEKTFNAYEDEIDRLKRKIK